MIISGLLSVLQGTILSLATAIILLCWAFFRQRPTLQKLPYPPGPPPRSFIFGNVADIPKSKQWVGYAHWRELYGDIVHFRVLRQHMVILNTLEIAKDLLEKRSNIYSDRPHLTMIDIMDWDFNTGLRPYGAKWRSDRRVFQDLFNPSALLSYRPIQTEKIGDMLYNLLKKPEEFRNHYKTVNAAIIMRLVYGYDILPNEDYFVQLAESAVQKLTDSVFLGAATVNALPFLRHLPSWFPGAGFKKYANESKKLTTAMREVPFSYTKQTVASDTALPSIVSRLLSSGENHEFIKNIAATFYSAAADTTASALGTFFYAMTMHPAAQKKAQEELDSIVGSDRLPTLDDRDSLPYIEALYREVLRWRPVAPLGVVHSTTEDDTYRGYFIPKGSLVIPNIWAMAHDPEKYENPELFSPDRYFDANDLLTDEDNVFIFGFGRRICPGRHFGSSTVWLAIASVLSTFNIHKQKDASGWDINPSGEYADGMISHPLPYGCSITPRSENSVRLVMADAGGR